MNKVICDICGTSYPDTSDQCPICGCARGAGASLLGEDLLAEEITEDVTLDSTVKAARKREIFDFDEVNAEMEDEEVDDDDYDEDDDDDYEEDEEEEGGHSTLAVILLTVLIIALLAVAGFLFVRYFLPNMGGGEETAPETVSQVQQETPVTEAGIPCQSLVLTSGTAELSQAGQYFLLHVQAMPEDTTDVITFTSADESIATVTEDGKITAVAEGETLVYITCGNSQLNCPVVVKFEEETVPPTEAAEAPQVTEPAVEETAAGETEADTPAESGLKNVTLKLKKTDIGLGVYYQFTLELDCDLQPTDVTWSSEHPHIASVDENGVVKALKEGTTAITAKYGDQTVQCIVRCHF